MFFGAASPTSAVYDPPPPTPIEIDLTPPTDFLVFRGTFRPASTIVPNVHTAKKRKINGDDAAIPPPDDRSNIDTEIDAHPFKKSSLTNKSSKK